MVQEQIPIGPRKEIDFRDPATRLAAQERELAFRREQMKVGIKEVLVTSNWIIEV